MGVRGFIVLQIRKREYHVLPSTGLYRMTESEGENNSLGFFLSAVQREGR